MALFKVLRGPSANLSSQPFVDGYAYFTPDDGRFYIDVQSDTPPGYYISSGVVDGKNIYRIEIESGTMAELYTAMPSKTSDLDNDVPFAIANADGAALSAMAIPMGAVDPESTAEVFTASVNGITELKTGVCMFLSNHVVTSTTNFTININNLGAKPVYSNMTNATRDTTIFNVAYTMLFIYDEALNSGNGGWWCYRGYNSDTNTIGYQLRTNNTALPTITKTRYYRLLFTSATGTQWVPANTGYDNSATSKKTVNQNPINPFGRIAYLGNSTNYNAGAAVTAAACWEQYNLTFGYSFNTTSSALTLSAKYPIYVKCAPQTDGSAIIDSTTPYVQNLPSSEDGKIYIFLGNAVTATTMELYLEHPVYEYKGNGIRLYNGPSLSAGTITYTPEGTISSVDATTGANYTPKGKINSNDTIALSVTGTTSGTVTSTFSGTGVQLIGTFTGTQGSVNVSGTTGSISTSVTTSTTDLSMTVSDEVLSFAWANNAPVSTVTVAAEPALLSASGNFTPSGAVTIGVGSGTANYTPSGTITSAFNGEDITSSGTATASFTGSGTKLTFTGSTATLSFS